MIIKKRTLLFCLLVITLLPAQAINPPGSDGAEAYLRAFSVSAKNNYSSNLSGETEHIIREPESPVTRGFDPLEMQSFPSADPTSKVELIRPPEVNNRGTAELTYHFETPPARNGMQPQLSIRYSSDAGTGRLGMGWDLYIPTITTDTILGNLTYNGYLNATTYLLDGEMLVAGQTVAGGGVQFYPRRQSDFSRIIRYGSSPDKYTWEITDKKGVKYTYGLINDKGLQDGVLKGSIGGRPVIAEWKLSRVEELHGDYIEYTYRTRDSWPCIDSIKVGNKGEKPHTLILFSYAGYFFSSYNMYGLSLSGSNWVITKMEIRFEDKKAKKESDRYKPLRDYAFLYLPESSSSRVFLGEIEHSYYRKNNGQFTRTHFATHSFDYYDDRKKIKKLTAYIEKTGDTELDTLLIDRTTKLQTVHNPLGGCFTIDYNYAPVADTLGKSHTMPVEEMKGKLVMSSVRVNDGVFDDGTNTKNEFVYSSGKQDDKEKVFLGYGHVTVKQIDTEADTVYRHVFQYYDVSSYYTRGNLLKTETTGSDPSVLRKQEIYRYYCYKVNPTKDNYTFTVDASISVFDPSSTGKFISFTPLEYTQTILFQDSRIYVTTSENKYTYYLDNHYGALKDHIYSDKEKLDNTGAHNYKLHIDYRHNTNNQYIVNLPTKVTVTGSDGKIYRETTAAYSDPKNPGQITQITKTGGANGETSVTDIKYDESGNITEKILPANNNDQRMTYTYLYDREYNMYVERVEDSFGYRTEFEDYDYRYGVPHTVRDMNQYTLKQSMDDLGRWDTIVSPNEQESGKKYTLVYQYNPPQVIKEDSTKYDPVIIDTIYLHVAEKIYRDTFPEETIKNILRDSRGKKECLNLWRYDTVALVAYDTIKVENCFCADVTTPAYAATLRYDYMNPKDGIETVLFADGTGRIIQEKKDAEIAKSNEDGSNRSITENSMIVSGRAFYDPFGRPSYTYHPQTGLQVNSLTFKTGFDQDASPTRIEYDVLDRITEIISDNRTTITYSIDNDTHNLLSSVAKNNGNTKNYYTNGSGLITKEQLVSYSDIASEINFTYDPVGQLIEMKNKQGANAKYEYDLLGRYTKAASPAGGETLFTYDAAGNLIKKQTANLKGNNRSITYEYDYNRLTKINYPEHPENDVTYTYGNKNASHNRVGRLMLQEDGSGVQEFFYGRLGEVSKVRRTLIIPNQAIATYVTQWQYDSWNRLTEIIYPDGEKATYTYNQGGLLQSLKGGKSYCYNYVKQLGYDKFEQRVYMEYGNNTVTVYQYDPLNQSQVWLEGNGRTQILTDYFVAGLNMQIRSNKFGYVMHSFHYDEKDYLASASAWNGNVSYNMSLQYDNVSSMRTVKEQTISQVADFMFPYDLTVEEHIDYSDIKTHYDANGNLTEIEPYDGNGSASPINGHQFLWDEENRLCSIKDGNYVSHYFYDAQGNRVVKTSGGSENVYMNAKPSGASSEISGFTAYVNPYMEISPGGQYTKHFFIGNERVASKLGDLESYGSDPRRIEYAGHETDDAKIEYKKKYDAAIKSIKSHYQTFGIPYNNKDNDDYVNGGTFATTGMDTVGKPRGNVDTPKENKEHDRYYYHSDRQGSTLLLTDSIGNNVQYLDYLPFGEPFVDKREGDWHTPYLFHGKEYDAETGFYYYDGRYYYPDFGMWLNAASPFDWKAVLTPYIFENNNPTNKNKTP